MIYSLNSLFPDRWSFTFIASCYIPIVYLPRRRLGTRLYLVGVLSSRGWGGERCVPTLGLDALSLDTEWLTFSPTVLNDFGRKKTLNGL